MKAFLQWIWNILIAIDQLGNTIAGGNPDITISARVGYFANLSTNRTFYYYWSFLEFVVDLTFYPLDGPNHCLKSLEDDNEECHVHGSDLMRALLGLIAVSACVLICFVTWTAYLFGHRPKQS